MSDAARVGMAFQEEGLGAAIGRLIQWDNNAFGPAMRVQVWLQWLLFGAEPFWWHGAKMLHFLALACGIFWLARLAGARPPAALAGVVAVTFFAVTGTIPNFQEAFINYARLFTTDSYAAPYAVWLVLAFLLAARERHLLHRFRRGAAWLPRASGPLCLRP